MPFSQKGPKTSHILPWKRPFNGVLACSRSSSFVLTVFNKADKDSLTCFANNLQNLLISTFIFFLLLILSPMKFSKLLILKVREVFKIKIFSLWIREFRFRWLPQMKETRITLSEARLHWRRRRLHFAFASALHGHGQFFYSSGSLDIIIQLSCLKKLYSGIQGPPLLICFNFESLSY